MSDQARRARIDELLGDRAFSGLTEQEQVELRMLLEQEGLNDDIGFELAAASLDLATLGTLEPPPPHVLAKVAADAAGHFAEKATKAAPFDRVASAPRDTEVTDAVVSVRRPRSRIGVVAPWAIAAVFATIAIGGWYRQLSPRPGGDMPANVTTGTGLVPCPASASASAAPRPKSAVERREELLAHATDVQSLPFAATKDPGGSGASGDVVWSSAQQVGFMRFRGLHANDRSQWQYQLWIFDKDRDDKYPVDGGVFDIDESTGDVVVAITPKVLAAHPKLFAITIEKPGGVVVSKREHIVLTAAI